MYDLLFLLMCPRAPPCGRVSVLQVDLKWSHYVKRAEHIEVYPVSDLRVK